MISLTPSAISHLKTLISDHPAGTGLRLGVERGGCAGMQYIMKMDQPGAGDEVVAQEGVSVLVDSESIVFLKDVTLDYLDSLNDSGFRIINPLASRSCGCGTSFEPQDQAQSSS
jgi:iron-sulfur cluster assembly accessory protein